MSQIVTDEPLVSIIMPTYNHAQFIGEAIKSVLEQSYWQFELIIVDNYSEDETEKVVASFNDDRIKYFKFRNQSVIAASRNFGIEHSEGQYIAFLDSDDMWLPEKLKKQVMVLSNSPEVALTYTRFRFIGGNDSSTIFPRQNKYKSGIVFRYLFLRAFIACSGVMARRSSLEKAGLFDLNPDLVAFEDTDLWLRVACNNDVIKVTDDSPLLLRRIQPQMMSSLGLAKRIKRFSKMRRKYKAHTPIYLFAGSVFLLLAHTFKGEVVSIKNYITRKLAW